MYTLAIRIGDEYVEVNYATGRLACPSVKPTVFNEIQKKEAEANLLLTLKPKDYIFKPVLHTVGKQLKRS
jgi:hypothetical protein